MVINVGSQSLMIFYILDLYGPNRVCKMKKKFIKRYNGNQLKIVSSATELNLLYVKLSTFKMLQLNLNIFD